MLTTLLGNPHSSSPSGAHAAADLVANVRLKVLRFFNASPDVFDVVFTANATAGIKVVVAGLREADGGSEGRGGEGGFWFGYHAEAHTSLVGAREAARGSRCFEGDDAVEGWISGMADDVRQGVRLLAWPAQTNMNGRRLPTGWAGTVRRRAAARGTRVYTLLDAAALVATSPLDLGDAGEAPDFTVLSFYKIFGFPDLGALIVRKEAGDVLRKRRYFGGGTVELVTVSEDQLHVFKEGAPHEFLEDGTLPIHNILALDCALDVHGKLFGGMEQVKRHTSFLSERLHAELEALRHANGAPVCQIYRPSFTTTPSTYGPVLAFNIRTSSGTWVSGAEVSKLAHVKNITLRIGGLCNPGGVASALGLSSADLKDRFAAGHRCGSEHDTFRGRPTGMLRASLGAMSTLADVQALVAFVGEFFVEHEPAHGDVGMDAPLSGTRPYSNGNDTPAIALPPRIFAPHAPRPSVFVVEQLTVYPIKSCAGWRVPAHTPWSIRPEGLAWDREWCLLHQGSRVALSMKRYPRMALLRPSLDLERGVLRVRFEGGRVDDGVDEVEIPLRDQDGMGGGHAGDGRDAGHCGDAQVCGKNVTARVYPDEHLTAFFSAALGVPCYLARFPPASATADGRSHRHAKAHLHQHHRPFRAPFSPAPEPSFLSLRIPGAFPSPLSHLEPAPPPPTPPTTPPPLSLANESPILIISRSSLNDLNRTIASKPVPGKRAAAGVFRANIVIREKGRGTAMEGDDNDDDNDNDDGDGDAHAHDREHEREQPWIEERWRTVRLSSRVADPAREATKTELQVLGPCRRCQMVCVDQDTAERDEEPFVSLARTRRRDGLVCFGVHVRLAAAVGVGDGLGMGWVRVGDWVEGGEGGEG